MGGVSYHGDADVLLAMPVEVVNVHAEMVLDVPTALRGAMSCFHTPDKKKYSTCAYIIYMCGCQRHIITFE